MIEGIDVSKFQGKIDWVKVAATGKFAFVFCKATDGTSYVDTEFKTNWAAIKTQGFVRGAYHFGHPSNDPLVEATHFVNTVGPLDPEDMIVLDIETSQISGPKFVDWVLTWLESVESQTGTIPIIYTGGPFFDSHDGSPDQATMERLARYPLWLAAYSMTPNKFLPPQWKNLGWVFWQRSGDVAAQGDTVLHVSGIKGAVDRDIFNGTLEDLKTFALNCHPATRNNFTSIANIMAEKI